MKLAETQLSSVKCIEIVILCLLAYGPLLAQEPRSQQLTAPPPMKAFSREEHAQIEVKDTKARIRATIELAEEHLASAELHSSQHEYDAASTELGKYWALIEDALSFLNPMAHDSNKTRDLYKRLELALRAHGPRLVSMRRTTPLEYAVWIKEVEDFARKGRTEALNSFYGHTVVREGQQKSVDEKPPGKQSNGPVVPETKQQ